MFGYKKFSFKKGDHIITEYDEDRVVVGVVFERYRRRHENLYQVWTVIDGTFTIFYETEDHLEPLAGKAK
jgi:hypothetical protein